MEFSTAVTVYQTLSTPITVASPIATSVTRDIVDYLLAFGSVGSLVVGLFAVWYSGRITKEGDLNRRFLDLAVSMSEEKFQGLAPVLNQMHHFVTLLESGVKQEDSALKLFWNLDRNYIEETTLSFQKLGNLLSETVEYQSPEFQTFTDVFKLKFGETTLDEKNIHRQLSLDSWYELIDFEKKILNDSIELIKLETNRDAIVMIRRNEPKKFYALLEKTPKDLEEFLRKKLPELNLLKEKYSSWRNKKFYKKPDSN